jgi:hypothetical protein
VSFVRFTSEARAHLGLNQRCLTHPIWAYERPGVTVRYGQLVQRIVPDLFGEIFLW